MRVCSRKRIIVYRKYVMFIKQSPTRFTMVTKNDTKTGHFLIYICRHICEGRYGLRGQIKGQIQKTPI